MVPGELVGLDKIGTHSLRKTFGYHVYKRLAGIYRACSEAVEPLASSITLRYIGIDGEKMDDVYLELNTIALHKMPGPCKMTE
jgi:hypothetical protein